MIGVLGVTPAGFFAILAMLVWIAVVSVMLFLATSAAPPPAQTTLPTGGPGQL